MKNLSLITFSVIASVSSTAMARKYIGPLPSYSNSFPKPIQKKTNNTFIGYWCNPNDVNDQFVVRENKTFSYFENGTFITTTWYEQVESFATSNENNSGVGFGYEKASGKLYFVDMVPLTNTENGNIEFQPRLKKIYYRCQ